MQKFEWSTLDTTALFGELKTREGGLSDKEGEERLAAHGQNKLAAHKISAWRILFRQLKSPFIYVLLFAAILSLSLKQYYDGTIIIIFIIINTTISFFQEYHSAKALLILNSYVVANAKVRRNGKEVLIPSANLVPGDIVIVETGDILPADVRFLEVSDFSVNESVLTGESVPVEKSTALISKVPEDMHGAENMGFSGTSVENGRAVGVVVATGRATAIGEIAALTVETEHLSSFEINIARFSRFILKMILTILVFLFIINVAIKGTQSLAELLIFSIALAISVIPEALPVVMTLSLSNGALRLAKQKVVVKRLSAVEDLGGIEILCTDKTGTLTENVLSVSGIEAEDRGTTLRYAALASSFHSEGKRESNNAFDLAIWKALTAPEQEALKEYERIDELPFDPRRRMNSVRVREKKTGTVFVVARGAPEIIFNLAKLGKEDLSSKEEWVAEEGKAGRRTIAIGVFSGADEKQKLETFEKKISFVGAVSFADPIKPTTKAAIKDAKHLGVAVKILTGDGPAVAGTVARDVDLIADPKDVITGAEFEAATPLEQERMAEKYFVFARMSPEQKYRVIEILQKHFTVGFLGEGINDAPALKVAGVGLVVNHASDIARDAADVVLLNSSLHVIVNGIRIGREIFENTVKYLKITLISNFGNFYAVAIAALLIPYLPMLPMQILLLNLLTDFPMIAIATDTVDGNEVSKPKKYNVHELLLLSIILGLLSTVFDFIFFALFYHHAPAVLQTNWFIGSVLTELVLIYSIRTRGAFWKTKMPSRILAGLTLIAGIIAVALPYSGFGIHIFQFKPPTFVDLSLVLGVVILYFLMNELLKVAYYRFMNHNGVDAEKLRKNHKKALV